MFTFELLDTGDDGLSYWADPAAGNGYLRLLAPTIDAILGYFEPEFGRSIRYSFVLGMLTDQENVDVERPMLIVGPNPAVDRLDIQTAGLAGQAGLTLFDAMGRVMFERNVILPLSESVSLPDLTSGMYWLRIQQGQWQHQEKIVIQRP
ncbi:MAG: T9SS type A sorting domain-containing protein [Saprospiraceae bacterium]|nr:T9SS type A sorting domain-containing protein [Saprospiraceae bacterium]